MNSLMKLQQKNWYTYIGVPFVVGVTMYGVINHLLQKKRRSTLRGKVVLITGASSGIGEALAHVFYGQGCKIILASRRKRELERVKQDLISRKVAIQTLEPVVLELNLADIDNMYLFVEKVYGICGHVDILVNNGGVTHRGSILNTKTDVDQKIMFINYFGSVALTKAVLPKMIERKSGHVVFNSSVQGLISIPNRSAYAASKHALQAFGDCLRAEMDQYGINVTVVSPGYIKTAISMNAFTGSGDTHGVMDATTAKGFTPEYTANKILDAVVNKKNELILSQFLPRFAIFLRHTFPSLYFTIMAKRANET
ncbi:dehydrogenase/reductase SDR family protein 7-like [Bombyx mori]|uniref:Ketoreductase domain-containing protein n=1 Tax=Bombyx mori TaxID=7091 RepID=A0A8R1WG76_BOMMO|nr:dehydrogenase/reductase SDR family protein 7-like [Bombyx mori]